MRSFLLLVRALNDDSAIDYVLDHFFLIADETNIKFVKISLEMSITVN